MAELVVPKSIPRIFAIGRSNNHYELIKLLVPNALIGLLYAC